MKRYAEDPKRAKYQPTNGYLAPCPRCGLIVVHGKLSHKPFHMHARSKLCRDLAVKK